MTELNMAEINSGIADRTKVFYWQADLAVGPEHAGTIWADRHRYFTDDEIVGFELFRLRYVLSKMTLRIRRYSWDPSEYMKSKIETGKVHLKESLSHFGLQ